MEAWIDVKGYEGLYQVSSYGRVKSYDRYDRIGRLREGRILKVLSSYNSEYRKVTLAKSGNNKQVSVHRLVACNFIDNPENKPFVNHIDENKGNNKLSNLEWVTHEENLNHGTAIARSKENTDWNSVSLKLSKPVRQIDINGNEIATYEGCRRCEALTGFNHRRISEACNGTLEYAYGYKWEYIK